MVLGWRFSSFHEVSGYHLLRKNISFLKHFAEAVSIKDNDVHTTGSE